MTVTWYVWTRLSDKSFVVVTPSVWNFQLHGASIEITNAWFKRLAHLFCWGCSAWWLFCFEIPFTNILTYLMYYRKTRQAQRTLPTTTFCAVSTRCNDSLLTWQCQTGTCNSLAGINPRCGCMQTVRQHACRLWATNRFRFYIISLSRNWTRKL